jgi:hypothetical protein
MKYKNIAFLMAIFVSSQLAGATPNSVVMLSNLPLTNGGVDFDNQCWIAVNFTVPPGDKVVVDDIGVALIREGHPVASTHQFRLYSNVANVPGKLLTAFTFPDFTYPSALGSGSQFIATFNMKPLRRVVLSPGTTYWMVATSSNQSQTDFLAWETSTSTSYGLTGATFGARLISQDRGATWILDLDDPPALGIDIESK